MVRKLPFSVRSAGAILQQIDPSLEEASINLGVPPALTFLRITVPLMLGGIVGGFVLTFVTVASELSATIVLYSGPWTTMPLNWPTQLSQTWQRSGGLPPVIALISFCRACACGTYSIWTAKSFCDWLKRSTIEFISAIRV